MKRIIAILTAIFMVLLTAACSKGSDEGATGTAAESSAAVRTSSSAAAAGEASVYPLEGSPELTVWKSISPTYVPLIGNDYENTFGNIELEERTGVKVSYMVATTANARESASVILASGEYPDIMVEIEGWVTSGLMPLYNQGIILELTDTIDQYMPNYAQARSDENYAKDTITDDGRIFGVYAPHTEGYLVTVGPVVRKDWLDDLGMKIPVTYDDYHDMLLAFKTEKGAKSPMWVTTSGVPYYNYLSAGYGVAAYSTGTRYTQFYQVDGKVRFGPLEDGWIDYMSMMQEWYGEGLIYKDFMSQENMTSTISGLVLNDESGLVYPWSFLLNSLPPQSTDPDFELAPIADAVKNAGDELHLRGVSNLVEQNGTVITCDCKNVEAAAKWLDYGYSEEGRILANYGMEGQSFKYVDGEIELLDSIVNNPEGYDVQVAICPYRALIPTLLDWKVEGSTDAQINASETWSYSDNDWIMPATVTMTDEESSEYSIIWTDIQTLVEEYTLGLVMGGRSIDEYAFFTSELKNLGIERCIELKQNALERYYAR